MIGRSTHGPRRWLRAAVAASVLAAACGGDDGPTGRATAVTGTYTLRTANGAPLPALLEDTPARLEVLSGSLTLDADHTFTNQQRIRTTENGVATIRDVRLAGTYTVQGAMLTLVDPQAGSTTATRGDDSITLGSGTVTFVYRR